MKKILLIGSVGCGKTTLMQRLHQRDLTYEKTQYIGWEDTVYDTPGEYLELWYFKHALWTASNEVDMVILLHAAPVIETKIPPSFHTYFTKPVVGVVTKIDIAEPWMVENATSHLRLAGCVEIYQVSAVTGEGLDELLPALE
jgi:ethanolamine utilization protein EutP